MDDESKLIDAARAEVEALQAAAPPIDSISGYRLLSEIHRGAQGVVYRAVQESTGQSVAIKVMREGPHAGEVNRARFDREVKVLAKLRHPNIVSILDSGSSAGSFFFVMDYVHGLPVDVHMAGGETTLTQALKLFCKICDAVQSAHLRGVIHRDLKPGNILIDQQGEPHVLDFGLAKVEEDDSSVMTMTGQFVGSVPWSSPEQADSAGNVDVRSDVYALGVVLYQMLTGKFPYDVTGNLRDVLGRIASAEPISPRRLRAEIDDELETILLMCLAKQPDRRYQTAGELARDLQNYLDGEPIQAKRDSTWYVFCKQLQKHRIACGVAAAFLMVISAGFLVSFTFWQRAEKAHRVADDARLMAESNAQVAVSNAEDSERLNTFLEDAIASAAPFSLPDVLNDDQFGFQPVNVSLVDMLDRASSSVDETFADNPELAARAKNVIGGAYVRLGHFDEGRDKLREALFERRQRLGDQHADTLRTEALFEIACAFDVDSEAQQAEAVLTGLVPRLEIVLGVGEDSTLLVRSALGHTVARQGRLKEGAQMLFSIHETLEEQRGEDDLDVIAVGLKQGYWMSLDGNVEQAEEMVRHNREVALEQFGPEHQVSIQSDRMLTRIRRGMHDIPEGDRLAFRSRPAFFSTSIQSGPSSLDLTAWDDARSLWGEGKVAEAAPRARDAIRTMEFSLGPVDPQTLSAKGRLAWELRTVEAFLPEAEQLAQQTLEGYRLTAGPDAIDSLLSEQTLGVILFLRGEHAEGERMLAALLERAVASVPEADGALWLFHWTHSAALRELSQDDRSQAVLRTGCEGLMSTLGAEHAKTRQALGDLAALSHDLGMAEQELWCQQQLGQAPREG
jgi:serine/threonine protein kinase